MHVHLSAVLVFVLVVLVAAAPEMTVEKIRERDLCVSPRSLTLALIRAHGSGYLKATNSTNQPFLWYRNAPRIVAKGPTAAQMALAA